MKYFIFYRYTTFIILLLSCSPIQVDAVKEELKISNHDSASDIQDNAKWPLKVSDNHRYLVDNNGNPFAIFADTGWDLMCATSVEDGKLYIDDRSNKNFTAIFSCLARPSDKSTIGMEPFYNDNLSTPNDEFFNRCREYIFHAQQKGMTMVLNPFLGKCIQGNNQIDDRSAT